MNIRLAVLGIGLLLLAICPSICARPGNVDDYARAYRVQVYETFHRNRAEYDRRIEAGKRALELHTQFTRDSVADELFRGWFERAHQASIPNRIGPLPSLPNVQPLVKRRESEARERLEKQLAAKREIAKQKAAEAQRDALAKTSGSPRQAAANRGFLRRVGGLLGAFSNQGTPSTSDSPAAPSHNEPAQSINEPDSPDASRQTHRKPNDDRDSASSTMNTSRSDLAGVQAEVATPFHDRDSDDDLSPSQSDTQRPLASASLDAGLQATDPTQLANDPSTSDNEANEANDNRPRGDKQSTDEPQLRDNNRSQQNDETAEVSSADRSPTPTTTPTTNDAKDLLIWNAKIASCNITLARLKRLSEKSLHDGVDTQVLGVIADRLEALKAEHDQLLICLESVDDSMKTGLIPLDDFQPLLRELAEQLTSLAERDDKPQEELSLLNDRIQTLLER